MGIKTIGDDGVVEQSEIVDFNNEVFKRTTDYYGDSENAYDDTKLSVHGQTLEEQKKNY